MDNNLMNGTGLRNWLVMGALVCGIGVVAANAMSFFAARGEFPVIAFANVGSKPASFGKIDYGATGSIGKASDRSYTRIRSVLDRPVSIAPCTGKIVTP